MKTNTRTSIEPLEQRIAPALSSAAISLGALTALTGGSLNGATNNENLGASVSDAGDFNGDGIADYIVGAPFAAGGGTSHGAAYLVFGNNGGVPLNLAAGSLNGTNGIAIFGAADGDRFGSSVAGAGDLNGDGFADVIIGAPLADGNSVQRGEAYVIYGHAGGASSFSVSNLDGKNGFEIFGTQNQEFLGISVAGAGDVNGDGLADVIVGATGANGDVAGSGAAYIIYGKTSSPAKVFTSLLTADQGTKLGGIAASDQAGRSVAGGGDINGDGFADVVIGAPLANEGGANRGAAYVVYGKSSFTSSTPLSGLGGASGFRLSGVNDGDQAGFSIGIVGDLNGDGLAEVAVGAPLANEGGADRGAAYVVFGKSAAVASPLPLSQLDGSSGFKLTGTANNDSVGSSVHSAGDLNGDGHGDLIIGASGATVGGKASGAAYVLYGKTGGYDASRPLSTVNGQDGIVISGLAAGSNTGIAVSGIGDVNHDGFADVVVGSSFAAGGGSQRGSAHVVYGGPSGDPTLQPKLVDQKTATFTDVDGDLVTVKVSAGNLSAADFDLSGAADHASFLKLKLNGSFAGANVTITAKPTAAGGDGHVNLGTFDATGIDLGQVTINGNVERFTAGDANSPALSVKSLTVNGLGAGTLPLHDTFGGTYISSLADKTGPITIKGDLDQASLTVSGDLAKLTIGGSLIGGETLFSGLVQTTSGGNIGPVKIGHDLLGGTGSGTGGINAAGNLGNVTIGGSQIGDNDVSAYLIAAGNIGKIKLGGDQRNGFISSQKTIGDLMVGGSLIADHATAVTGLLGKGGIGQITVKGDIEGLAGTPYQISGGGALSGAASVAIKGLTVSGSVENAVVLGGAANNNGHAQIGTVIVNGDWTASSIVAGAQTSASSTKAAFFGNSDDTFLGSGPANVVARIASIVIKGEVSGSTAAGDHFGFVAKEIGALKVGAVKYKLATGATDAPIELGQTGDFTVRELA